jgi:recombination protein RecR
VYQGALAELIDSLNRLPGVGPKSAQRLAFYFLQASNEEVEDLAQALLQVKSKIRACSICGAVSEVDLCNICSDSKRDLSLICVVEEVKDISALEKTREFKGRYHVLGGAISPIDGVGPDQLRIKELVIRVQKEEVKEIILATNPNLEGEATASYLTRVLEPSGILLTRLASGLPVGGELEYADEVTLGRALIGRRRVSK